MSLPAIDRGVEEARGRLSRAKAVEPAALFLMGTGAGLLPGRLEGGGRLPLDQLPGVPAPWREGLLHWGTFNGLPSWILEDATDSPDFASEPWERAFPCWLAAAAGAATLVHTCAGSALPAADGEAGETLPVGTLALVSDHINLSGGSPLQGLGASNLGPMFPDLSGLHEAALRHIALAVGERLGLHCAEAVAACTLGPTLDTPAERRWFARAGASVAVQGLADPLIASAHAGLSALGIVVVVDAGDGPVDLPRILAASRATAPALDDLLWELAGELQRAARAALGGAS